ncbi:MAG: M20/M25/M40 family metallo-hydrolase [Planctomycetaceae bacterium]|mgnify:CR=1 FL=1|nr:M20/M25/M40 family metallo-hydrolase [Planctomycetaceae bacterium]
MGHPGSIAGAILVTLVLGGSAGGTDSIDGADDARSQPNWIEAGDEAVRNLAGIVKIDTSDGNETKVARYIKAILDKEGIESEILELQPGRGNLVARLRGNGTKRPILLMGHTDVVGVEREKWSVEPFGGDIKDGYLYGRGALDNKDNVAVYLEVFLLLHRLRVPLDRDVIFLAQAGEEGAWNVGMNFMVARHWDKIDCEFALDEGGAISLREGRVFYVGVSTTEKVPRGMRLIAKGTSGHGSIPLADNAITHLAAAVAKVGDFQMPMRLNETTRSFFEGLAAVSPADEKDLYSHLEDPARSAAVQEKIRIVHPRYDSMLRTSISPTIIQGGFRSNVIPAQAEARLDVRAVPGEDIDAMVAALRRLIDDPAVQLVAPRGRVGSQASGIQTDMFRALEKAQRTVFPEAATLPVLLTGATNMAPLRARGVQAYGLGAPTSDEDSIRVHGNDERVSVAGVRQYVEFVYHAVTGVAATRLSAPSGVQ